MPETDPLDIGRRIQEARKGVGIPSGSIKSHHFGRAVMVPAYTDATRPTAASVGAGATIYNSDDNGLNVSDGANWRMPGADGGWVVT